MSSLWVAVIMFAVQENGCNGCLEKERIALLQLKHSINFPDGTSLPSWEEDDSRTVAIGNVLSVIPLCVELSNLNLVTQEI
ncbi:hypothetical protein RHMOL_Rhmol01G0048000 [Rhododendron molle]|uniref:Uncharacterized protein n=1 Tax=Rhododendron molle TaxID=49168 RepID=A0ACC0PZM6_RHOML|nr:hypothetical protein RHMOL_Rhmol01G0048000 [Rhododendron molle]